MLSLFRHKLWEQFKRPHGAAFLRPLHPYEDVEAEITIYIFRVSRSSFVMAFLTIGTLSPVVLSLVIVWHALSM
jgi:hypothetical protein